jgi:hypothetical protein
MFLYSVLRSVFDRDVVLRLGNETIPVAADAIKISFSSNFFPFQPTTRFLRVRLKYGFVVPTISIESAFTSDLKQWNWNITSDRLLINANFQGWALVDGQFVMNEWDQFNFLPIDGGVELSQRYQWPRFNNTIIYDPDFRMLVLGDDPSITGPTSQPDATPPWIYAAAIVPVAVICVLGSAIVFHIIKQKRAREAENLKSKIAAQSPLSHGPAQYALTCLALPSFRIQLTCFVMYLGLLLSRCL